MVLGGGMIATALKAVDREEVLYAASGLSNLKGADSEARLRERTLLSEQIARHTDKLFVYVSSYSVDDRHPENNTPYLQHKLNMESLIKAEADRFLILRTSNVVGHSRQPGNLMNFIFRHLQNGEPFDIWTKTTRNLIDVAHLAQMADAAVKQGSCNEVLFLTHPADIPIYEIVHQFEVLSGLKANYRLVDKGVYYHTDKSLAETLFRQLRLEADPRLYTQQLIEKYFGHQFL
ncbi:NAD-dependent epimerase/dehydratase family protein [Arachidicoccus terrestris]|uniref:NAD-dependent epimerase/dehydratase family protein n=1 Tax=Arachidicoccus terrestris TaxID=2875539 RepID=UPI001CC6308D|nr:NAD-dependent epimerase/dehydratase family protein [Arachidicoccus terrestris]UAY56381.1 sugar nucleotide-binding protein [Arachidicoccus terrestris]